jgi:hypothetical protein
MICNVFITRTRCICARAHTRQHARAELILQINFFGREKSIVPCFHYFYYITWNGRIDELERAWNKAAVVKLRKTTKNFSQE